MITMQKLIPELDVENFEVSKAFYISVLGFTVQYSRPEEKFAMLTREGVQIMIQEAIGPGRRFRTAPLDKPYGRGVNFQILVADIEELYRTVLSTNSKIIITLEEKWYKLKGAEAGNKQFVVADPDGYLLRFFQDLGQRNI
jgi:catechol 2,3-dioxygenase-like lactoylglutathione lyase family enzyme